MAVANYTITEVAPNPGKKMFWIQFTAASGNTVTASGLSTLQGALLTFYDGTTSAGSIIASGTTLAVAGAGSYMGLVWGNA